MYCIVYTGTDEMLHPDGDASITLYWSNEWGYTSDINERALYFDNELADFNLPADGKWVKVV